MARIFVYGTLKRGCQNHSQLAGQRFLGDARTTPGYRLYHLGEYPGMVADPADNQGVTGEVWDVSAGALARLDAFEGIHEGLYRREPVALLPPFDAAVVETYIYARDPGGHPPIGDTWRE